MNAVNKSASPQRILFDLLRRNWRLCVAASWPAWLCAAMLTQSDELPVVLLLLQACNWLVFARFKLADSVRTLRYLAVSQRELGRTIWWCVCGGCLASMLIATSVVGLIAFWTAYSKIDLSSYICVSLVCTALLGHSVALLPIQELSRGSQLSAASRTRSWIVTGYRIEAVILCIVLAMITTWPSALLIAAATTVAMAALTFLRAEQLVPAMESWSRAGLARNSGPLEITQSRAVHVLLRARATMHQWLPLLVFILVAVLSSWKRVPIKGDHSVGHAIGLIAVIVLVSGVLSAARSVVSLAALRVLPLTKWALARRLCWRAALPILVLGGITLIVSAVTDVAPPAMIIAATLHLAAAQSLWPSTALDLQTFRAWQRVLIVVGLLIWMLLGIAVIAAGGRWLAWLGAPLIAAIGLAWTHRILRTHDGSHRPPTDAPNVWAAAIGR